MTQLSAHFTLQEAMASKTASALCIDNTPPESFIPRLRFVAETILEPIRANYGIPLIYDGSLSWYRCPALNTKVGGAVGSQHTRGEAVDVEVHNISNIDLAQWVRDNLEFDQLILENWDRKSPSSGWVHVSAVADRPMRFDVLTYAHGKYTRGLP